MRTMEMSSETPMAAKKDAIVPFVELTTRNTDGAYSSCPCPATAHLKGHVYLEKEYLLQRDEEDVELVSAEEPNGEGL